MPRLNCATSFRINALFVGANIRAAVAEGRADYLPVFLSEAPALFRQRILPLVASGAVTGECKKILRGKILSSFVVGSQPLYDFVHDNPIVELRDSAYVNDTQINRQNPNVTAINSALEIDLTGQVCADSRRDAAAGQASPPLAVHVSSRKDPTERGGARRDHGSIDADCMTG